MPGMEVLNHTFKGHIDPRSKHSHITIHNSTIEMHGRYKCLVKTDLGSHEVEQDLTVISQTNCKLNDWRVISQPTKCSELFRLDCRGMFPRPVTSCGLWNGKLDKFIRAVMVDVSEEQNRPTYRISYVDNYELQLANGEVNPKFSDLLQYAGHLMFKCDIIVPETSWKLSLVHRMFDFNDGCYQDPLETIDRMRINYSNYATNRMRQAGYLLDRQPEEFEMLSANLKYELVSANKSNEIWSKRFGNREDLNCWQKPRLGTLAKLSCASKSKQQFRLIGASLLECQSSGWVPIAESSLELKRAPSKGRGRIRAASRVGGDSGALDSDSASPAQLSNDLEESGSSEAPADLSPPSTDSTTSTMSATDIEFIPTSQDVLSVDRQLTGFAGGSPKSPSEMASLLPSCVSTSRRQQDSKNNRLPLIEGSTRTLESSNARDSIDSINNDIDGRPTTDQLPKSSRSRHKSLFEFAMPSSANRSSLAVVGYEQILVLAINLLLSFVALPLIIYPKCFHVITTLVSYKKCRAIKC